jgi:hypothetical protein
LFGAVRNRQAAAFVDFEQDSKETRHYRAGLTGTGVPDPCRFQHGFPVSAKSISHQRAKGHLQVPLFDFKINLDFNDLKIDIVENLLYGHFSLYHQCHSDGDRHSAGSYSAKRKTPQKPRSAQPSNSRRLQINESVIQYVSQ